MSYVLESVAVKRPLPGAALLLGARKRCGCHNRMGIGDYTLGDQPNVAPVFPNLTPATIPPPPNIPILDPSSPIFTSLQLGAPSLSPSGGASSSWISLVPSLASIGTQIAGAASGGGANVSGSSLTAQQQAAIAAANQPSWFSQSSILSGISNGWVIGGTAGGVLLLMLLLRRRKR